MDYKITKEKILEAAKLDARYLESLKVLFPEAFEPELASFRGIEANPLCYQIVSNGKLLTILKGIRSAFQNAFLNF